MEIFAKLSKTAIVFIYIITAVLVVATIGLTIAGFTASGWFFIGAGLAFLGSLVFGFASIAFTLVGKQVTKEFGSFPSQTFRDARRRF